MLALLVAGTGFAVAVANTYDAAWRVPRAAVSLDRFIGLGWLAGALFIFVAAGFATSLWTSLPTVFGPLVVVIIAWAPTPSGSSGRRGCCRTGGSLSARSSPRRSSAASASRCSRSSGAIVVPRLVANSSELYGTIGAVFALLVWLLVLGRLVVYVSVLEVMRWERKHGTTEVLVDAPTLPA